MDDLARKVFLEKGLLHVTVKPNKQLTAITGYDAVTNTFLVDLKAPAHDNKANEELVKFMSRMLGQRISIKSGSASKQKMLH